MDIDVMKLAFAWNAAIEVIMADGDVAGEEAAMVAERYASRARDAGLVDKDGHYTPLFRQALAEAPARLSQLPRADRLALLGDIVDVVMADGVLDLAEADRVNAMVHLLGLEFKDVEGLLAGR
jgi:hypothetical protein